MVLHLSLCSYVARPSVYAVDELAILQYYVIQVGLVR